MIEGGYYIKARKIQDSKIANCPPHVREIWDWLIKEVNHKDNGKFKRGQTMRSLRDIQEGLKWYVGYRKMMYSKSKCEMSMNWLRKEGMIKTMKTTRGMIITVCNYNTYQDPKNYETNNENITKPTRNEQTHDTINKNDKNVKNDKNEIYSENGKIFIEELISIYPKKYANISELIPTWNGFSDEEKRQIIDFIPEYIKTTPKKYISQLNKFFELELWKDPPESKIKSLSNYQNTLQNLDTSIKI